VQVGVQGEVTIPKRVTTRNLKTLQMMEEKQGITIFQTRDKTFIRSLGLTEGVHLRYEEVWHYDDLFGRLRGLRVTLLRPLSVKYKNRRGFNAHDVVVTI